MVGERPPNPNKFWGWWAYAQYDNVIWAIGHLSDSPYSGHSQEGSARARSCPDKSYFSEGDLTSYCHTNHFWSFHPGGGNWLLADGSVQFITYDVGDTTIPLMAGATEPLPAWAPAERDELK
jgi:prepilin-type processing-associated H-X9-DG protein